METSELTMKPLTTDAEWGLAARMKRDRDYAAVLEGPGDWTEPGLHALHEERWGAGEAEYQLKRLREDAGDGELLGWFSGGELVAMATARETTLIADEGPRLLIVSHLYVFGGEELARRVAGDLAEYADARGIEESDLTVPAEHGAAFAAVGFGARALTMRRRWRG